MKRAPSARRRPHPDAAPSTVRGEIRRVEQQLKRARLYFGHGTASARDEAAWLVGHVAGIAPEELANRITDPLSAMQTRRIERLVQTRVRTRRPLAYLIHEAWFAGLKFYIDRRVIVPRSLTAEFIQERFAPWVAPEGVRRILDLGTGSGCMAIATAYAFPHARVDAVDISRAALAVARVNIRQYHLRSRVRPIQSDLFAQLGRRRYDVIVCNPPYVSASEMKRLPAEYRHEPERALAAGADGLDVITRLLTEAAAHLTPRGILVVETGNSCARVATDFPDLPFVWLTTASGDDSVFLLTAGQLKDFVATPSPSRRRPRGWPVT